VRLALPQESDGGHQRVTFGSQAGAQSVAERLVAHPDSAAQLSALSGLSYTSLLAWTARQLWERGLKLLQRVMPAAAATPLPPVAPPAPTRKPPQRTVPTSWIKLQFLDDLDAKPVARVTATLTLPDGTQQYHTSPAEGLIEVAGITAGSCALTSQLNAPRLPGTLSFIGTGAGIGGPKSADDVPIAESSYVVAHITPYKVKKGDTLASIAANNGLSEQDLAVFNFGTSDGTAVNRAIRARVGAKTLGPDKQTYLFDDADKPGLIYLPRPWQQDGLATEQTHTMRVRPVVPRWLALLKLDDHFAPGKETLEIQYSLGGLAGRDVFLEVTSEFYKDNPIFKRALTAAEKTDGDHELEWDGKANASSGDLKDHFISPLFAPYKVRLYVDTTYTDEAQFKVLYHSLRLAFGSHTPDGKPPASTDKARYAQFRLNELGYDGGPVDGVVTSTVCKGALRRFQRGNYQVGTTNLLHESGTLDDDTFQALQSATARVRFEAGKDPLTEDRKLYVDDNYFNDRGMNMVTGSTPEFNSADRKKYVEDRLERPYIALEAQLLLLGKAGGAVDSPDGVGPATIAWEADDGPEDATVIAATNAAARTFVANAIQHGIPSGGLINQTGDNAPKTLQGFREASAADNVKAWYPDDAASKLLPFKVRAYGSESRGGKDYHRALVDAWADLKDHPERKGRAGVYFRHTFKGGDDAKLRAAISFEGLPNKQQLIDAHKDQAKELVKETGRWTVWRRAKMNAYCQQAGPTRVSGSPTWATIAAWWHDAFIEMEHNGAPATTLTYGTVVPAGIFKSTVAGMPGGYRPAGIHSAADVTYRPSSMYGGPAIAQHPNETPQAYLGRAMNAMLAWITHPLDAILGVIHQEVRKTAAEGLIVFDFRIHDPLNAQVWDPTLNAGAGGFVPSTNPAHQNRLSSTAGYVRADGAVTMNVDNPFNVDCYVLHECGHARFLYHHKTGGGGPGNPSDNPTQHDPLQERCAMSYGIGSDTPDQWQYSFCGKCILRLRGWKVS
jgi:LysM repeat protein